jgi:hypothetical protein
MRKVDWLLVAIIAAFLGAAVAAHVTLADASSDRDVRTVSSVAHFVSWPVKSHPVRNLCPMPPRRT